MDDVERPKIIYDSREGKSLVIQNLKERCILDESLLAAGDFILSDRVCCERKTTHDFVNSITDRRLFEQIVKIKRNFVLPILLIEGNELYDNNINPDAIRGALASVAVDLRVPILWTRTPKETADMLYTIAKHEQFKEKRAIRIRGDKKPKTIRQQQEYLVGALPGIDFVKSRNLLKHFKCPEFLFTASEKELKKVDGIGKVLARRIREIVETEYE
ncbi:MAG: ERCC4 domain-containing protein [Candidatus Aenigmatarchaeota archaeon]